MKTEDRLHRWFNAEKWCATHSLAPLGLIIRLYIRIRFSCDIPYQVTIGKGTKFPHDGLGMLMHHDTVIGNNCIILHGTTFGGRSNLPGAPHICDNVIVGAHSILLGPITVGNNAVIGAGSVVLKDVPENAIVAGNPARILRFRDDVS